MNSAKILREVAYEEGYKDGERTTAEQVFKVLEEVRETCVDNDGYFLPGAFMNLWLDLQKKYNEIMHSEVK